MENYWEHVIGRIRLRGFEARRKAQQLIRDMENGYQIVE